MSSQNNYFHHKHTSIRRAKTLYASNDQFINVPNNKKAYVRDRMMTIMGSTPWIKEQPCLFKKIHTSFQQFQDRELQDTSEKSQDPFQDRTSPLAKDYIEDINKIQEHKVQAYRTLRNKMAKKFPSFKKRYIDTGYSIENTIEIQNERQLQQYSLRKSQNEASLLRSSKYNSEKKTNNLKDIAFYSRSKKRCLTNALQDQSEAELKPRIQIPKLTYFSYLKHSKQRKVLQRKLVKGSNMIKDRDNILKIQKEGTKSYAKLKQTLEEAIQLCKKK